VVLTYHSLEDRLVKNFMRSGNFEGEEEKDFYGNVITPFSLITKKGIVPGTEELESNNRARSARLRVAEKKG
jgi:16S rRNA (cytosine1402-N4)-methyltransferase